MDFKLIHASNQLCHSSCSLKFWNSFCQEHWGSFHFFHLPDIKIYLPRPIRPGFFPRPASQYFWVISAVKALKVGPTFSNFNPRPSLSSTATDDRKQSQCFYIVLNNKTGSLFFLNSVDAKTHLSQLSKR